MMTGVILVYAIAFLSIVGCSLAVNCTGLPDGVYEAGCRSFARCSGGELTIFECPPHLVYNNVTDVCDSETNVLPPCGVLIDCQGEADGLYPDLDQHCTAWYTCLHGKFLGHNFCPPGTVFDITLATCNWRERVPEPCGTYKQP